MKKMILICLFSMLSAEAFSQLDIGNFKYKDENILLTLTVSDDGGPATAVITYLATNKTINTTFEYRTASDMAWYEAAIDNCYYEFDKFYNTKSVHFKETGCNGHSGAKEYTLKLQE